MGVYVCVLVTQSCPTLCNPMDCVTLVVEKLPARAGDTGDVGSVPGSVASVVSDSVRPHRWQPTRLPRPWDSPDKNTGVGCHFLLQRF